MTHRWLLAAILALAAFLRLYQLDRFPPGLYSDEAMDGNNAMEALETRHFQVFYPEDNGREGLYADTAALAIAAFGNRAWALRLPAVIYGVLTVWGLWLLVAEWIGRPEALLAAFFLATSFWHLVFSRMAFRAIAAPLFLVWSMWLLLVAIRRGRPAWFALAGAVYGLGFYTYPAYRITVLLIAAVLWTGLRRRSAIAIPAAAFALAAVVAAAPLAWYFVAHPDMFWGRAAQVSIFDGPRPVLEFFLNCWRTGRMLFTRGDRNWRHNVAWQAELFWPVAAFFVIGLWPAARKYRLAMLWLLLAMLPAALANLAPHALRSILMLPAVCLIAALGARQAYEWLARHMPARILNPASALLLLTLCFQPYHAYFHVWATDPKTAEAFQSTAVALAWRIAAAPANQPKIVVDNSSGMRIGGLPEDLEPVMYLTATYTRRQRDERHIRYVSGEDCAAVAAGNPQALVFCAGF